MRQHRTIGVFAPLVLGMVLLTAGAASFASAARQVANCRLEVIDSGGAFAAVLQPSNDPDMPDGRSYRVAAADEAPADPRSISLRCSSPESPIKVGINSSLITSKHVDEGCSGVEVVQAANVTKACGFPAPRPEYGPEYGPELHRDPLLYFCGDYHVEFTDFSIQGVQLLHQLSWQQRRYLVMIGGGSGDGRGVGATIHQGRIINSTARSAIAVTGNSHVNISELHCSGIMGRLGACLWVTSASVVQLQHSTFTSCSAVWGGGLAASENASVRMDETDEVDPWMRWMRRMIPRDIAIWKKPV